MKHLILLAFAIFSFILVVPGYSQSSEKTIPVAEHYEGGQEAMLKFIQDNIIYPPTAKRNRMQGECIISFVLEADGRVTNYKVVKNVGGGTGEEALRVVKLLKFRAPGYRMQTSIPVKFKL